MFKNATRDRLAGKVAAAAVVAALMATPLVACSGQQSGGDGTASESGAAASQAATVDTSSWKTMGDVFAAAGEDPRSSAGWNEKYYVCAIEVDGSYYRVVAQLNDQIYKELDAIDWSKEDAESQNREALSEAVVQSVDDLSVDAVPQDELDAFVGKTGKDLEAAGFTFQDYYMYGGEQAGADYAKGSLAYMFTFNASVAEDDTDDGGAALSDATITEAELDGASADATNPDLVS